MSGKVVAVDIGGTNLRAGLVSGKKVITYIKTATPKVKEDFLRALEETISRVITKNVKAIGVGSPGPLKNGIILNPPNLPLKNFNLKKFLENKFKKKVVIENDAACVALSELVYGVRKKNFVILTLGTGVGGGIIIDGKLYRGKGNAGELGHMIIDNKKDLEFYWKNYKKLSEKNFGRVLTINELCTSRNKKAKNILKYVTTHLAEGITNLIDGFDPEVIVLMGGAREAGKKFIDLVKKDIKGMAIIKDHPDIRWSRIKHPGILGASLLVR
ncbi:MAG: ROK family protein [Nanoarchaeota archaeon]